MKTIKYTKMDKEKIITQLMQGGILAFPTDTVFGLACIMDKEAIRKVYIAKGRDFKKPLPMMCDSLDMIKKVAYVKKTAEKIINKFTPGALTVILNKKEEIDDYITQGNKTIGIRVPDDEWILDLISRIGPLMVTSANISNEGSLLKWEDVYESMKGKIDGIVCEDARGDRASTIIDLTDKIKILREGPISLDELEEILK
ncbi:MAG: threonylcarbamoyl-AMP synthase [Erysipelotrichaceae bacterium]|nr:threonylcarbamoyl-AMP synthase [Erysipelotrichaceae bacterium]